jgi:hypothetical protein
MRERFPPGFDPDCDTRIDHPLHRPNSLVGCRSGAQSPATLRKALDNAPIVPVPEQLNRV